MTRPAKVNIRPIPVLIGELGGGSTTISYATTAAGVQYITANGSNFLMNPIVNFAQGSNITLTLDTGDLPLQVYPSNTIRIHSTGGSVTAGSNSTRVSEDSAAGASTSLWSPFDHRHDGIGTITASSSNTMQRGTFNLRSGTNISFGLTDSDGDGELDTMTINSGTGGAAGSGAVVWLQRQTASSSAQLDFTNFISADYSVYIFELNRIYPASNDVGLRVRVGTGGGPTYDTGTNYTWAVDIWRAAGSARNGVETAGDYISLNYGAGGTLGVSNTANHNGYSGTLRMFDPQSSVYKHFRSMGRYLDAESFRIGVDGMGQYESATAITAIRFYFSTGNITSGFIDVYGVKHA